ncbi:SDR family oxidoreductase [Mycobacterium sp. 1274756.6]|uniref:SDR family oxidoreductase n=1 Tax=Mycobacterium sp. 1274756.6 TaxID=1834076 RepID=UPI0008010CFA|nr:SDR family oxidoreductase [Mycobacterium sp. 1274756.6]OBJ73823.1 short-chain dehydrogenase [Mycobacterium sp. 1274756.6]
MADKTVLVTGAGTGFGNEVALRLAERGLDVIAGVEIYPQVWQLEQQAEQRGVQLRPEKLDVTHPGDRRKAAQWDVDVLVNNAGVAEGGAMVDIPAANLRHQFEVNVIGPVLLTQAIAKKMAARRSGKIVFMSSTSGMIIDPFGGAYAASKFAIEAIAETMHQELAEFNVEVATVNPGSFLTGFNDRMLDTWQSWEDDPATRLFDYSQLAFASKQHDPEPVYRTTVAVVTGESDKYRNVVPESDIDDVRQQRAAVWDRKVTDGRGERLETVQAAYDLEPETRAP